MSECQGKTIEMAFFPYKASMWDSMESIWQAANADPDCHTVVVPIPYVDKDPNGNVREEHYEIDLYPEDVPVVDYREYNLQEKRPDIAFIHNPYDHLNLVTSVHPDYYSFNLKKWVKCLVYTPYFALSGNLNRNYSDFSAYHHVDYIVTQGSDHRKSFDPNLPDDMFLPFGSPKFDSVIRKCKKPAPIPAAWKERMEGKEVFFFNTSLRCAVNMPDDYLKKIGEVFKKFAGREDVCLVWRPHPLLEATFESMEPGYGTIYRRLRDLYIRQNIGIYDDTPCMEDTISWCDAYLGDEGSSVISSFGVAGKPIYILNDAIHGNPGENDWRGEVLNFAFNPDGDDRWIVTRQGGLWYSEKDDYRYRFVCDLVDSAKEVFEVPYIFAREYGDKVFALPFNAQNIAVYEKEKGAVRYIDLKQELDTYGAFTRGWLKGRYLWLQPGLYPYIVRVDAETEEVSYLKKERNFLVGNAEVDVLRRGMDITEQSVILSSPADDGVLRIDPETLETQACHVGCENWKGTFAVLFERPMGEERSSDAVWLLPMEGYDLIRYDLEQKTNRVYHVETEGIGCMSAPDNTICDLKPFENMIFPDPRTAIIAPFWANMYVQLDLETGECVEWDPPHEKRMRSTSAYLPTVRMGGFAAYAAPFLKEGKARIMYVPERRLYDCDFAEGVATEIRIVLEGKKFEEKSAGFQSVNMQYCCKENAFVSLQDIVNGTIPGRQFDPEKQKAHYAKINASPEGDCGEKVYRFLKEKLERREA